MTLLDGAVRMCKYYGLKKKEAEVCCELFKIVLRHRPDCALAVANNAISADPNNEKVRKL